MAPVTTYYLLSIIFAAGLLLYIVNLVYLRKKGRTTFGQEYKVGTPVYTNVLKLASNRNIAVAAIIELCLAANLIWVILTLWRLDTQDSRILLVSAPIAVAGLFVLIISSLRKQYQTNKPLKKSSPKKKDDGSWQV